MPSGTQMAAAKRNTHVIDLKAPLRVTTLFEAATYVPNENELTIIKRSPIVVCDENEALRGSIRSRTPIAAAAIPAILIRLSFSVPIIELTVSVKIGIVTARREVFDAFVSDRPVIKKSWLKVTPKRLSIARRQ